MKLRFILTGEGSSDLRLVEHIGSVLIEEGFTEVRGEAPDLSLFSPAVGRSVREKLMALARHYPNSDVIFVHRDADNVGVETREQEVWRAALGILAAERIIPVIPVTMLETWLLADAEAIKRVAGNSGYKGSLECIPGISRLEKVRDSKQLLCEALCEASQTQGSRLKKFKGRFADMRARLTFDLDPNGPVKGLDSYRHFRTQVNRFSQTRLGAARKE